MDSPIFKAIDKRDHGRLRQVLLAKPELSEQANDEGVRPILYALYHSNKVAVETILAVGPALTVFEAAALGDVERLAELIAGSPDLKDSYTPDGHSVLGLACFFGQLEAARLLLRSGADANAVSRNEMGVSAIHAASAADRSDIVALLIESGADVNARQQRDFTALHAAAQHGNAEMARMLLEAGADSGAVTNEGKAAADLAAQHGHDEVLTLVTLRTEGKVWPLRG
ncbi:MAG: ankyrin repeat domain-containing protein [Dehalococcoidia bacterium]